MLLNSTSKNIITAFSNNLEKGGILNALKYSDTIPLTYSGKDVKAAALRKKAELEMQKTLLQSKMIVCLKACGKQPDEDYRYRRDYLNEADKVYKQYSYAMRKANGYGAETQTEGQLYKMMDAYNECCDKYYDVVTDCNALTVVCGAIKETQKLTLKIKEAMALGL